jgi:Holliday junction resolvasome RuvABC ATP-dependent DNA helicase subunit
MDFEERITASRLNEEEEGMELSLRPRRLTEYIGQKTITENLKVFIRLPRCERTFGSRAFLRPAGARQDDSCRDHCQ